MKLIDQYNRDGYVIVRNVLDADLIKEASDHVEWLMKKNPGRRPETLWQDLIPNDPFWVRLISDPRLLDVAQEFIGHNIALFASHYLSKPAGNGMPVLWHQDGSYWPLDPMEVVTLWLAVDDSTPENGCMRVIPGTQHLKLQQLKERKDVTNVLNSEIDASFVDESKAVDIILKAGDLSVHHPNVIHGSNANTSPQRRCGLTIRYIPTSTRITVAWGCDFVLRGAAVPGINEYKAFPRYVGGETKWRFAAANSGGNPHSTPEVPMITKAELKRRQQEAHGYFQKAKLVITPAEQEKIEVADFGLSEFEKTGLGVLVYVNTLRCCAKELAMWPRQTCPEHRHPNVNGQPGKEETFRCRWGKVFLYVAGAKAANPQCRPPAGRESTYTVWHEIVLNPGDQYTITPNVPHWFQAGDEGAVVSEFSTHSTDENDIFTDQSIGRATKIVEGQS